MKKVLTMLLVIGLASTGVGLGTALGAPVALTSIKLGDGTAPGYGMVEDPAGTFTVSGTGTDIWSAGDSFEYAYMSISGDFDFTARVVNVFGNSGDGNWTKAGLMCRANISDLATGAVSPFVNLVATTGTASTPNGLSWQCRKSSTVGDVASQSGTAYTAPVYLRLTRTGNVFNGYYSQDGQIWTKMPGNAAAPADLSIAMTDPVYLGLSVTSHSAANLSSAVFDEVTVHWGATNPTPAAEKTEIDYPAATQLKWDALANPDGAIKDWSVYFGSAPADPNVVKLGTVSEPTREFTSPALEPGKTYYWRVDATNVANSEVSRGFWWSFSTKSTKPYIDPLVNVSAAVNCLVTMTATAKSGAYSDQGDMTFVWKKSDGTVLKTDGPGSAITSSYSQVVPAKNDPNTFFVEVTNANGTTKSNEVTISIILGTPSFQFTHLDNGAGIAAGTGGSRSGNTYTLIGSGNDIWNNADSCEFAYLPISGDGTITVRVASLVGNASDGGWTKAGAMIRGSLDADAQCVTMLATTVTDASNGNRSTFQYRATVGATCTSSYAALGTAVPKWERLVRSGNTFTGFYSPDGVTWTQQSSTTVAMPTDAYVGLAVTAHSATNRSTATFDNITSTFATSVKNWEPTNPTVSPLTPQGWVDPTKVATLSWVKADGAPCGSSYKVYYGTSPTTVTTLLGTLAPDVFKLDVTAKTFPFNATIYWRADTVLGADTVTGAVWSFDTVMQYPVISTNPALITVVDAGATANLNIVATTATVPSLIPMVKYEWFFAKDDSKVGEGSPIDDGAGNYSCPLALADAQVAKEGEYYCVVTNTVGSTTSNKGRVLTHRMMLHYTFEQVVSNVIADQSPSGFDATLICPAAAGIPKYSLVDDGLGLGNAIKLIGPNDPNATYITTNKKPMELGINGNFPKSVSVWAKAQAFNNGGLFDMGAYVTGQNFCLRTLSGYNNRWRVQYYSMDRDVTVDPSFDRWVHFVLVFDGVNSQLYVNGQLARDVNGNLINYYTELDTQNGNNVVLGRYNSDVNLYIGLIDDFRLYNYALTAKDAAELYVAVKGGPICVPFQFDLDGDCQVNLLDFANFAAQWAQTGIVNP